MSLCVNLVELRTAFFVKMSFLVNSVYVESQANSGISEIGIRLAWNREPCAREASRVADLAIVFKNAKVDAKVYAK